MKHQGILFPYSSCHNQHSYHVIAMIELKFCNQCRRGNDPIAGCILNNCYIISRWRGSHFVK